MIPHAQQVTCDPSSLCEVSKYPNLMDQLFSWESRVGTVKKKVSGGCFFQTAGTDCTKDTPEEKGLG